MERGSDLRSNSTSLLSTRTLFMGGLSLAVVMRSIKVRDELRLYAAGRLLEFSFSPGYVSQHGVQPLWSQDHESEHKHEQDFCSKTHDSPLG
jgi:hypothetical protein